MRRRKEASLQVLEIVHGPLPKEVHTRPSAELRAALPRLNEMIHDHPRAAVHELREWIAREPNPMLFNWLGMAYGMLGEVEALRETVRENYARNPRYLFARVNQAQMCVRDGDLAGAREALGASFDIRALLGGRRRVHVSEFAAYFYVVGLYHLETGDMEAAEGVYDLLAEGAPDETGTDELRRLLYPRLRDLFFRR
ncbi:hypothetical protein [Longimicrobium sp.]|uniref:tetratricopeptide repeat protein n=1 Tax=Longimicrobium sp. TaxID=2029185 RepID=UPI002E36B762|nr:hypothetical protein [Longimicrobium sp.]HEX6039206.1 hypothetical protein [Longimicrobium sp.]